MTVALRGERQQKIRAFSPEGFPATAHEQIRLGGLLPLLRRASNPITPSPSRDYGGQKDQGTHECDCEHRLRALRCS